MAAKHSRHIALTGPLAAYVEAQIAKGEYASASEMVRAGLRLLKDRDEARPVPPAGAAHAQTKAVAPRS